jgi:hypothetical protein
MVTSGKRMWRDATSTGEPEISFRLPCFRIDRPTGTGGAVRLWTRKAASLAVALCAGCAGEPDLGMYGWNASTVDYLRAGPSAPVERLPAALVLPADRGLGPPPHAIVLFGREDGPLRATCDALQSGLPRLRPADEAWTPLATAWPDLRAADELVTADAKDCDRLADYYDLDRSRSALAALGLAQARGPVLVARPGEEGEAVVLDLSALDDGDLRRALSVWRERITSEPRYWAEGARANAVGEDLRALVGTQAVVVATAPAVPAD